MAGPSKDKATLDAVQKWFSNALGAQTAKQLARAIDTDKSGYVDVLEYMQFWCVQIGGTNSEKITTFFNLLDADGMYTKIIFLSGRNFIFYLFFKFSSYDWLIFIINRQR